MKKLLLVIDMQKEFINKNTKFLAEKIEELIDKKSFDNIIFTKFINNKDNAFYKKLKYTGCIQEEDRQIIMNTQDYEVIEKTTYTALNEELKKHIAKNEIQAIYLCGIDTESCVLKTAFDMFEEGYNIYILKDYCACTYGNERHNNAIKILERNIGKEFVI